MKMRDYEIIEQYVQESEDNLKIAKWIIAIALIITVINICCWIF